MLDTLKQEVRSLIRLALVAYDKLETDPNSIRNRLAFTHDNRKARENPVRLVEDFVSIAASAWEDELVASGRIDKLEYTVPMKGYHAFFPYNEINIGRPNAVAKLPGIVARLPIALMRKQVKLIMNVFRANPVTVDGQNFFSASHTHINDAAYDNTIDFEVADLTAITFDEAKAMLHAGMGRLAQNQALEAEVVDAAELQQNVIVIAHNAVQFGVFDLVRTQSGRNNVENELKGKFTLLLDQNPASGQEDSFEMVYAAPGGARPAFYVPDASPYLDVWKDGMRNGFVAVGMKEIFGVKAGHAHTTVRVSLAEAS